MARTSTTALPNNPAYDVSATVWNGHVNDYVSQSETGYTQTIPYSQSANYTVIKSGATFYALNGDTGVADFSNADLATLLTATFAGLTAARTWQEKVVLKVGVETGLDQIVVPSYTILESYSSLTAKANLDKSLVVNSDVAGGNSYISLVGGTYDMNNANQTADCSTVYLNNVLRPQCYSMVVNGGKRVTVARGEGIELYDCDYGDVAGNYCYNAYYDNIKIRGGSTYCTVRGNICVNSQSKGGIQISSSTGGTSHINIIGNNIYQKNHALDNAIRLHGPDHVNISNNVCFASAAAAIEIIDNFALNNIIKDNVITTETGVGVNLNQSNDPAYNTIKSNHITVTTGGAGSGGIVLNRGTANVIKDNYIYGANNGDVGLSLAANSSTNYVGRNQFFNCATKLSNAGTTNDMLDAQQVNGAATGDFSTTNTEYSTWCGNASPNTTESQRYQIVPEDGYLTGLYVRLNAAPNGAGKTRTFTIRVNAANTAQAVTLTNAETTKENVQDWVAVARGDRINIASTVANTPVASTAQWGCKYLVIGDN